MRWRDPFLAGLVCLAAASASPAAARVMFSGEVRAVEAQPILTPPSLSSPVVLRYFVPEGTRVRKGDVLVRIDPGPSAEKAESLARDIEQAAARAGKEIAELAVKANEAERALVDAEAAFEKARIDAEVPRAHRSALDYDRFQGELQRTTREKALKQRESEAARAAVRRREEEARLERVKLGIERDYHERQVGLAELRAEQPGVVVHGFDSRHGTRYEEGASTMPGQKIGEVVAHGPMAVRAWILEADRAALAEDAAVRLYFDALPGKSVEAHVRRIAGAPDSKAEWGNGSYYTVDIDLPAGLDLPLLPGMSVRVEPSEAGAAL